MQQPIQGQQKSIRNTRGLFKNDTDNTEILRLPEDVDLDTYQSPKKGITPMTNVLSAIGNKESFGDAINNKKSYNNLRSNNFRYNRFNKFAKKVKSSNRGSALKKSKESIKQPIPQTKTNNMKQAKRYGSVPKNLNNSFPSIKNPAPQNNSGVFNYAIPQTQTKLTKKNMNIYKQNTAANIVVAQYSSNNTSGNNLNYLERSMSPLVSSQKMPSEVLEKQNRITTYENMNSKIAKALGAAQEQKMIIK